MGTSKLENQISINGWKPDLDNHMRIDFREIIKFSKPDYLVWTPNFGDCLKLESQEVSSLLIGY